MAAVTETRKAIAAALDRHGRAALLFSGGKDSVVLADLVEPFCDRIELIWVNTGAMFPHMTEFVRSYGNRFKLTELRSDWAKRFATVGLPSRVVPIFNTPVGTHAERTPRNRPLLTDWVSCCAALRSQPIEPYLFATGITLMIHGQRKGDNVAMNLPASAAEAIAPLWGWSDAQVKDYIQDHDLRLPDHYAEVSDSLECWSCTADYTPNRYKYMARSHPNLFKKLVPMLDIVHSAVIAETTKLTPTMHEIASLCDEERGSTNRERTE
jgi:3'-phosphoadenosine 5'-phosphosulfate sulfotransferase (PAPS reductase)/FAD synthetase